jgi:hypothetical protein
LRASRQDRAATRFPSHPERRLSRLQATFRNTGVSNHTSPGNCQCRVTGRESPAMSPPLDSSVHQGHEPRSLPTEQPSRVARRTAVGSDCRGLSQQGASSASGVTLDAMSEPDYRSYGEQHHQAERRGAAPMHRGTRGAPQRADQDAVRVVPCQQGSVPDPRRTENPLVSDVHDRLRERCGLEPGRWSDGR